MCETSCAFYWPMTTLRNIQALLINSHFNMLTSNRQNNSLTFIAQVLSNIIIMFSEKKNRGDQCAVSSKNCDTHTHTHDGFSIFNATGSVLMFEDLRVSFFEVWFLTKLPRSFAFLYQTRAFKREREQKRERYLNFFV